MFEIVIGLSANSCSSLARNKILQKILDSNTYNTNKLIDCVLKKYNHWFNNIRKCENDTILRARTLRAAMTMNWVTKHLCKKETGLK